MTTASIRSLDRAADGRLTVLTYCPTCRAFATYDVGTDLDDLDLAPRLALCSCPDYAELEGDTVLRLRARVIRRQEAEDAAEQAAAHAAAEAAKAEAELLIARTKLSGRRTAARADRIVRALSDLADAAGGTWEGSSDALWEALGSHPAMTDLPLPQPARRREWLRGEVFDLTAQVHGLTVTSRRTTSLVWTVSAAPR